MDGVKTLNRLMAVACGLLAVCVGLLGFGVVQVVGLSERLASVAEDVESAKPQPWGVTTKIPRSIARDKIGEGRVVTEIHTDPIIPGQYFVTGY